MNLKNSLLTIALAIGTITLAQQNFTPKLIIKNMTGETITFCAPENAIAQLKAYNSPQLHTFTIQAWVEEDNYEETLEIIEFSRIKLNPDDTLTLDSIPEYLTNQYTKFLSPQAYAAYNADLGLVAPGSYLPDVKPFIHTDALKQKIEAQEDIVILLQKSEYAHEAGGTLPRPCEPHEQYLEILPMCG